MSRFDDLVRTLAPHGVEFKALGDVGEFVRGTGLQKSDLSDHGVPAIHYGQIHTRYGSSTARTISFTDSAKAAKLRTAQPGNLIIATTSEDDAAVAKATAWLGEDDVVVSGDAYIYRHQLDPRYVAYVFQSRDFQRQKSRQITGTKVRRVSGAALAAIRIPVPPIEIQREVVRVLGLSEGLQRQLRLELKARTIQYAYCGDHLMRFSDGGSVHWMPLGEAATIVRGASPRPIQKFLTSAEDGIPWIKIGDVARGGKYITHTQDRVTEAGAAKSRRIRPGDFVLSNSMSFGRPYISQVEGCIHDGWLAISDFEDSFLPDFLYHLLRSRPVQTEFQRRAGTGAVRNLNAEIVKAVAVPVPSMDEQRRIVGVLDKFDLLINDPAVGISAEMQARTRQFEHYLERLLTFDEAVA